MAQEIDELQEVYIPDENLALDLQDKLKVGNKVEGKWYFPQKKMASFSKLDIICQSISDISGLEYATGLKECYMWHK